MRKEKNYTNSCHRKGVEDSISCVISRRVFFLASKLKVCDISHGFEATEKVSDIILSFETVEKMRDVWRF